MAIKKTQLYSMLWECCNALRGSMDASQYKNYVLTLLFVKYLSDKRNDPDCAFTIPKGCTFDEIIKLKGVDDGEQLNEILIDIEEANPSLKGVLEREETNFANSDRLGEPGKRKDTIKKLIAVFEDKNLDFSKNRAADDDIMGDAYEYLMRKFASESGKSKGQFYTPAEVSRILARVIGVHNDTRDNITIYDPTCGSGSLLLRAKSESHAERTNLLGQESDNVTLGMARMSMIIHNESFAQLWCDDTLAKPHFKDEQNNQRLQLFDYVVANPPFSQKNWYSSNIRENDPFGRWSTDENEPPLPPNSCGDYAFLLHIIASIKADGKGACILPHGVLFRGNEEYKIRKAIINKRYISGIIGLPANLFYGTGISACVVIIDKEHASRSKGIFMIDAKELYMKDGAKNRLREQDIKLIVDTWESKEVIPHFSKLATWDEIEKNDFNLNIPRYVAQIDTTVQQDIERHLHGNLPIFDIDEQMAHIWQSCTTLKDKLYKRVGDHYELLTTDFSATIDADSSFIEQRDKYTNLINQWVSAVRPSMMKYDKGGDAKQFVENLSASLLDMAIKSGLHLIEPYNVYQLLMSLCADFLQDDAFIVKHDGWFIPMPSAPMVFDKESKSFVEKNYKKTEYFNLQHDLLPVRYVVAEYFAKEQQEIDDMSEKIAQKKTEIEEFEEAHRDDFNRWEGLGLKYTDVLTINLQPAPMEGEANVLKQWQYLLPRKKSTDEEKVELSNRQQELYLSNKALFINAGKNGPAKNTIAQRLRFINGYSIVPVSDEILAWLKQYKALQKELDDINKQFSDLKKKMKEHLEDKYKALQQQPEVVQSLVVEKKWIAEFIVSSKAELARIHQQITTDITALAERYEHTLGELSAKATDLEAKVTAHLKQMGFVL